MLIATLPTLTGTETQNLSEEILRHSLVDGARYNTGGASPYTPKQILETLKPIADRYKKILYVDLEGRQARVAAWTPFSRGAVTLNRDFNIELPGKIHFRRGGWCDIVNALPEERKIFFKSHRTKEEYYLGESQSVNVVAKNFEVKGYLYGDDFEYIKAAVELDISHFMLSFTESLYDVVDFYAAYHEHGTINDLPNPQLVLKIESQKGIEFVKKSSRHFLREFRLMAARDDLFLSFADKRPEFLSALKLIIKKNPKAILASKILSGLLDYPYEVSVGDMTDITLMNHLGYRHFMLQDELADNFELTMQNWQKIIVPLLREKL
ncbi:MAG: hypothetical protein HYV47_00330 [Candidatus Nealsonbacteria bacterium]|nr:hypothetical protein [Candidatus Nealsonbacteria bacterium]